MTVICTSIVRFVSLSSFFATLTVSGRLSPDGSLVPVCMDTVYNHLGSFFGEATLFDMAIGEALPILFPEMTGMFRWQG